MTSNQYEARYLEALNLLRAHGKAVDDPYRASDGQRYVPVDGVRLTDESVFAAAWGPMAAEKLHRLRPSA